MDKQWFEKLHKSRWHITKCIEEAYKLKNIDLILTNVKRLHELTAYYEKYIEHHMNENKLLKEDNQFLEQDNIRLMNENFMLLSKNLGENAYKNAKRLMDEYHHILEEDYGIKKQNRN